MRERKNVKGRIVSRSSRDFQAESRAREWRVPVEGFIVGYPKIASKAASFARS